jgi:hypothetical protein
MKAHLLSRPEPLLFHLEPAGEALLTAATEGPAPAGEDVVKLIELDDLVPAEPKVVSAFIADISQAWRWMPGFLGTHVHSAHAVGEGAVFDEVFNFMTLRLRVLRDDPGREWLSTGEGCTLPLGRSLVQRLSYLDACGRTRVRWQVAVLLPPPLVPVFPVVGSMFRSLFARGLENLAQLDWSRHAAELASLQAPPLPRAEQRDA